MNGRIKTTEAKAKEIKSFVEKLMTIARKQNLASFRLLLSRLPKDSACKLYYDLAPKYKNRHSGQLKIVKMAIQRKRDAAKMAIIEFVQE